MRTAFFIIGGMFFWALCVRMGRLDYGKRPSAGERVLWRFLIVWLLIALINLWLGVSRAGYSVHEELPIFCLIFGLPALIAGFGQFMMSRRVKRGDKN